MKFTKKLIPVAFLTILFMIPLFTMTTPMDRTSSTSESDSASPQVDIGDGNFIEVGPGEELHRFVLTEQGWVEWSGKSSPLVGGEYGNSTTITYDNRMTYETSNTTTKATVNVTTGDGWEAYYLEAVITDLTENRTWVQNPDFSSAPSPSDWVLGETGTTGSSTPISAYNATGDASGDGCIDLEIDSFSTSAPYWYDAGDRAYATQTMTIDRGPVVWAGLRLDYWADTRDDTHYGMTGSFSLYVNVEGVKVWETVFDSIAAEETWYDSGLIQVSSGIFSLPSVDLTVGLWSKQNVGYDPDIGPRAKIDNVELYVKTLATPANVNLELNNEAVTTDTGWGSGHIYQTPITPWTTNPVPLNFTWWPTPTNPSPNRRIIVEFDVNVNMFARRLGTQSVYDILPTAFGEQFTITNGTDASFASYFYANIPDEYVNRYYFNETLPLNRDVYMVAKPLDPATNLTSGWTGGNPGDGYLNVSTYDVATAAGRYGYWRILSTAPNMITDLQLWDPNSSSWKRTVNLRAGNTTQVRVYTGASYQNSVVNITVFAPDGSSWYTELATVDVTGYATTSTFVMDGTTAPAGNWMVQAFVTDEGTNTVVKNVGFFKRPFTVTHSSEILITYPSDAVGTWTTNVTYGDLVLVILKVNDTDSNVLVPGGTLQYSWAGGSGTFDDSGTGEYTQVLDTSTLPGKGQFVMDLTWARTAYDSSVAQLVFNVYYDAELTSPEYPGISGPIGVDQSFSANYTNVNGTGILGATITCNWTGSYVVTETGGGLYRIDLSVTGVPIGEYPVEVVARAPYVLEKRMVIYVEVREIYNTISYTANQLSIPLGESASFTLTWTDIDNNQPITGSNMSIVCNWTQFHTFGEQNYTVIETAPGEYEITIFTQDDDPLTAPGEYYTIVFNVTKPNYQNHTFIIQVQIRSHNTLFILDQPVAQTPYTGDIVVLVEYRDTDLMQGIDNSSGYVQVTVSTPGGPTLTWSVSNSALGVGHYNITLKANQWGTIGWKDLNITIEWTGPTLKYYSQTIETSVRILGTDTDLYLEQAPTATYYLDNFTFTAVYWDAVNLTRISNSSLNVFVTITPITAGHPVTQSDFVIQELVSNPGTYEFRLNSSLFGQTGSFKFQIDFSWRKGQPPLYENKTMTVTLLILERPTYVDFLPVASTPYGENANFTFSYVDTLSTQTIQNSSVLSIYLTETGINYNVSYSSATSAFTLTIDTAGLGGVGTFTLHVNIVWTGEPYYEARYNHSFTITVTLRSTQLTHLSFAPSQWGNNVSIEFVYTDLVSGSSVGMVGSLTLNDTLAGWYTVVDLGNGHYLVTLNTSAFPSDGVFAINATIIYTGTNFEANANELFSFAVNERVTQLAYDSPDPTPYLENVSFVVTYSDDTTGKPINTANVIVTCTNSTQILQLNVNYWISPLGTGQFQILVDSTALGSLASYPLTVTLSHDGVPFYANATKEITARVIQRATQILLVKTPGDTPFLENVTFRFKFSDFLTGQLITIDKSHITLSHGVSMSIILPNQYALHYFGTFYEISFNSTILNSTSLVSTEEIQLSIDKSSGAPFYAPRNTTTTATTIERPTQILFPLVESTPYLNNISIMFEYTDYLTDAGISGATIDISFLNLTSQYYLTDNGDGSYLLEIPSDQFGGTGSIYFNLTASKSGVPFYASRTTTNVQAVIRLIQTSLISEAPPAASLPIGAPHIVNVTFKDVDHNQLLTNAAISTDWGSLYGTNYTIEEIGGGVYRITINTTGLLAQQYTFQVFAEKMNYQSASATVTIQPGALTVDIYLDKTTYYTVWGSVVSIKIDVIEPYYGTGVPGMTAELLWNTTLYNFMDLNNGSYLLDLDTTSENYGTYDLRITVYREFYPTRTKTIQLIVSKAQAEIVPENYILYIYPSGVGTFWVYLNDTVRNLPISDATLTLEWNDTVFILNANGTPGYYLGSINATGFVIGTYTAKLRAITTNYDILDVTIDVNVVPVPTTITVNGGAISLAVLYGENLTITVEYNDTFTGLRITGASVTYSISGLSGSFEEFPDGTYVVTINTTQLTVQSYSLKISAAKGGFAIARRTITVSILSLPTELHVDLATKAGYFGDTLSYRFYYNDTHNNLPILDADVSVTWEGGVNVVEGLPNGTYIISFTLNLSLPRTYEVSIQFSKPNYLGAFATINVVLLKTPATIQGIDQLSLPINESATVVFTVYNDLNSEIVTGLNGYAYWELIGTTQLEVLENGSYVLTIPDDLPIATYHIEIGFSSTFYHISTKTFTLTVRQILTTYFVATQTIKTSPGSTIEVRIQYWDVDHNVGIEDVTPEVSLGSGNITYNPQFTRYEGNGTYVLIFVVNNAGNFQFSVTMSKKNYVTQQIQFIIQSSPSEGQLFTQNLITFGGSAFIILGVLLYFYVRVLSVPQILRWIGALIRAVRKGKVPKPPPVPTRQEMVYEMVNEGLEPMGLQKELSDIDGEPIKAIVPEVEELLARLADITGLGPDEIEAFRTDLAKMRASERPGFLREVIAQEEARRAEALAEPTEEELKPLPTLGELPSELEDLKQKLRKKGMTPDEIEIIIEQAKSLSKADLDALLRSLGLDSD